MDTSDFYTVLGVDRDADTGTIRQAFKKLALIYHPDKVPEEDRPTAEVNFKIISEAYEVLGNDESRMIYDTELQFGGGSGGGPDWQEFYAGPQDFEFEFDYGNPFTGGGPFGGGGGPFGGGGAGFGPGFGAYGEPFSTRTEDVIYETAFTLEDVYTGKVVKLSTQRQVICRKCKGTGGKPKATKRKCHSCNGTGATKRSQMVAPNLYTTETVACPVCAGQGRVYNSKNLCKRCEGKQVQPLKSIIEVYVPKGVKNNHKVVVPQQADEEVGKTTGDLIILVKVDPNHPTFRRCGLDLYASTQISLQESLAGFSKVAVTHLDGRKLQVTVNKGQITGPNSVLKIPGEGLLLQHEDGSEVPGDMYIQVDVEFPQQLSEQKIDQLVGILSGSSINGSAVNGSGTAKSDGYLNGDLNGDGNSKNNAADGDNGEAEESGSTAEAEDVVEVSHETLTENELPEYEADANDDPEIEDGKKMNGGEKKPQSQPKNNGWCVIM